MERELFHTMRITTFLTVVAAFLMGFIDAYTFTGLNHVFVSAQTGNMVTFGVKLFTGSPYEAIDNVLSFAGFLGGAFLGEILLARFTAGGLQKYRLFLYVQALLLLLLAIFQHSISVALEVTVLGMLAGYALTTFRKIGSTAVNNGIMTGNARNMMGHLYKIVFEKDLKARRDFLHLAIGILTFTVGVGAGASAVVYTPSLVLWIAFGIVAVSIVVLFFYRWT